MHRLGRSVSDLPLSGAVRTRVTPAQLALPGLVSWLARVSGTIKLPRLEENIGSQSLSLKAADFRYLDQAADDLMQVARYAEQIPRLVDR